MKKSDIFFIILGTIIMLLPVGAFTAIALQEPANSPLERLQDDFRTNAERQVIRQWTRPHTIIFTSTGRTFKHATKISPDGMTCSFFCEGKHYFISGTYIIEEE